MLSPTGQCRPFDAGRRRLRALLRRDRLRTYNPMKWPDARWPSSSCRVGRMGVGQDGRTTGVSLPSRRHSKTCSTDCTVNSTWMRRSVLRGSARHRHAGGVIRSRQRRWARRWAGCGGRPLPIGSIKSNVGHLEPASGLAGALKAILHWSNACYRPSISFDAPNPNIAFEDLNLAVASLNQPLITRAGITLAGVNSFGFGGTIAHVVLRVPNAAAESGVLTAGPLPPLLLSATLAAGPRRACTRLRGGMASRRRRSSQLDRQHRLPERSPAATDLPFWTAAARALAGPSAICGRWGRVHRRRGAWRESAGDLRLQRQRFAMGRK